MENNFLKQTFTDGLWADVNKPDLSISSANGNKNLAYLICLQIAVAPLI